MARARRIEIAAGLRRVMRAEARRAAPRECCGFLVGTAARVHYAVAATNVAASRTRFRIDDRAHIDLRRVLRAFTPPLRIVGVYHSHPNGRAFPSATDTSQAYYRDWTYVIVSSREIRAFRFRRTGPEELNLVWI